MSISIKRRKWLSLVLVMALVLTSFSGVQMKAESGSNKTLRNINDIINDIILKETTFTYNGKAQEPEIETISVETASAETPAIESDCYEINYFNNTNAGTATITLTGKDKKGYTGTYVKEFTINPAKVTVSGITANDKVYDGTTDAALNLANVKINDLIASDKDKISVTATGTFADENAGEEKTVTISDIQLRGSKSENYALNTNESQNSTTATISQLPLEIKWNEPTSFVYDGNPHEVTAKITNIVGEDKVKLKYKDNKKTNVGKYTAEITGIEGADSANYVLGEDTQKEWSISQSARTVSIKDIHDKDYDGAAITTPDITLSAGDKATAKYTYYTSDDKELNEAPKNAGKYKVKVTVPATANYAEATDTKEFEIKKRTAEVTLKVKEKTYDGSNSATVTAANIKNLASNETCTVEDITGHFSDANVETDKVVTIKAAGVKLAGPTADNYNVTITNESSLRGTITARNITIAFDNREKTYGDKDPEFSYEITQGEVVKGDDLITPTREPGENVGTYKISGTCGNSNYNVKINSGMLTITKRNITIEFDNCEKICGEKDPEFSYKIEGTVVEGDDLKITPTREPGEDANAKGYKISATYDKNSNYEVTITEGTLTIKKPTTPTDSPVPPTDSPVPPTDSPAPPTDSPEPPTDEPTPTPTAVPPTDAPTTAPTAVPTAVPTVVPTVAPTAAPAMKITQSLVKKDGEYFAPISKKDLKLQIIVENADKSALQYQWYCNGKKVDGDSDTLSIKVSKKGTMTYTCDIYNKATKETKKAAGSWKITGYNAKVSITFKKTKKIKDIFGKELKLSKITVPKKAKKTLAVDAKKGTIKVKKYCKNVKVTLVTKDGKSIEIAVSTVYPRPKVTKNKGAVKTYVDGRYCIVSFKASNVKGATKVLYEYSKKKDKGFKKSKFKSFYVKEGNVRYFRAIAVYGKQKSPYSKVIKIKG